MRVALYGAITRAHSLATANRHLAAALVRSGEVDLSLVEVEPADAGADGEPVGDEVRRAAERLFAEGPEVTIRHGYPPSFARPPAGRLVVALPWEFGAMPRDWRSAIHRDVDEVWACSRHLRDGYLASGLDPERVTVVPHGVDHHRFRPGLAPLALPGVPGGFRFLFVGGLLWRKGIDLLLDAYAAAFTARDDVTLVIKDFGRGGPYQPQEAEERVRAMAADRDGPRVAFLRDRLTDDEIPRLYASCDCLVHPYRGEGYGLTVAEGMAVGLPVIVPEGGSTADFCDEATALLVPSHPLVLDRTRVGDLDLVGRVSVIEVLALDLAQRMREAYERPEAAREVGRPRERAHPHPPHLGRRRRGRRAAPAGALGPAGGGGGRGVSGAGLTTIVLPCHDNLLYTALCLQSIARHTPEPHEVVVVDNGCTDATSDWAAEQGARVVRSPVNLGFAGGVNLGLAAARGDVVVVLNNDALATPGLARRAAGRAGPRAAAPASPARARTGSPTTQILPAPPYAEAPSEELDRFAAERARAHAGQGLEATRLSGLCMAIARPVLDRDRRLRHALRDRQPGGRRLLAARPPRGLPPVGGRRQLRPPLRPQDLRADRRGLRRPDARQRHALRREVGPAGGHRPARHPPGPALRPGPRPAADRVGAARSRSGSPRR